jgi:hypothetical protein
MKKEEMPIFVWIKTRLELKILIHILEKEWNYNCTKVKNNKVRHKEWFKINREEKKLEIKNYWDPLCTSSNTVVLMNINKFGPYTIDELNPHR